MSLDHLKTHGLDVQTDTNNFHLSGRPCELSAFSFVPTRREDPPERTAFNTTKPVNFNLQTRELCLLFLPFTRPTGYTCLALYEHMLITRA